MCGICGQIQLSSGRGSAVEADVRRMCRAMIHRGPDDEGIYINNNGYPQACLGHRRLSIIDLTACGHQPMSNEDNTLWLVLNGEFYNYSTLRKALIEKGHVFRSNTDTETAIHLYEEYGEDFLQYLHGMFALALWDENKNILILARDRVGKKPLLYHYRSGVFSFSSELAALLESKHIAKDINKESLDYYLTFGYIPAPLSIYHHVFKLPPASILILSKGEIEIKEYWRLDYVRKVNISEQDAATEVLRLLQDAVKIRMYSDVPLGAFLSGGIDSSAVVALMCRYSERKVRTFSIGFQDEAYNELSYARNIANKFGTDHHEFIVKPDICNLLPVLVERYGEPYADSSCVPTFYLSQQTKRFVTVALSGDGADESFAGYDRYQAMIIAEKYTKLPVIMKGIINILLRYLPDSAHSKNIFRKIKRFSDGLNLPLTQRYLQWVGICSDNLKKELYSDYFLSDLTKGNPFESFFLSLEGRKDLSLIDALLKTDMRTYLPNDLLVKVDIASMANSLEARAPFLDHTLMEFAASLPSEYKINKGIKKYILKMSLKGLLPDNNINRPKTGFGVPLYAWLRNELKDYVAQIILSERAIKRGYFKADTLKYLLRQHLKGSQDYSSVLWSLLMLELWHQRFID